LVMWRSSVGLSGCHFTLCDVHHGGRVAASL